jgi:hypothetical protein
VTPTRSLAFGQRLTLACGSMGAAYATGSSGGHDTNYALSQRRACNESDTPDVYSNQIQQPVSPGCYVQSSR